MIPAGGRLTAFLNANGIREVDGAPLLDGTVALVAATEAAVRIRRQSGAFVSRRRLYAKAPEASIAAAGPSTPTATTFPRSADWPTRPSQRRTEP